MQIKRQNTPNLIQSLISRTKSGAICWLKFEEIKKYLDDEEIGINRFDCFRSFFQLLRSKRRVLRFSDIYFTAADDYVYAISKSSYSASYDLYCYAPNRRQWIIIRDELAEIVRLYNVIMLIDEPESTEDIVNFLYAAGYALA